jgi:hypothetical protein
MQRLYKPDEAPPPGAVPWWNIGGINGAEQHCPYGQPGDRLWVREAHYIVGEFREVFYRATSDSSFTANDRQAGRAPLVWSGPWKPSIHMPRWASRITLTVTDVRVHRVQEISHDDAVAEGACIFPHSMSAQKRFRELWDSLNATRGCGWDANPWVVALTFTAEQRNIDEIAQ